MKVIFSEHARKQNLRRKIPTRSIIETVKNPEDVIDSFRNRKLRRKKFGDKILEVATITEEDTLTVITQYWLKQEGENL